MGLFDTYATSDGTLQVQIKAGRCRMNYSVVGESCPDLQDGIYLGNEGAVVIQGGKIVAVTDKIFSKWGDVLDANNLIKEYNPIGIAINEYERKRNNDAS